MNIVKLLCFSAGALANPDSDSDQVEDILSRRVKSLNSALVGTKNAEVDVPTLNQKPQQEQPQTDPGKGGNIAQLKTELELALISAGAARERREHEKSLERERLDREQVLDQKRLDIEQQKLDVRRLELQVQLKTMNDEERNKMREQIRVEMEQKNMKKLAEFREDIAKEYNKMSKEMEEQYGEKDKTLTKKMEQFEEEREQFVNGLDEMTRTALVQIKNEQRKALDEIDFKQKKLEQRGEEIRRALYAQKHYRQQESETTDAQTQSIQQVGVVHKVDEDWKAVTTKLAAEKTELAARIKDLVKRLQDRDALIESLSRDVDAKKECLFLVNKKSKCMIKDLTGRTELNGKGGTIVDYDTHKKRYTVQIGAEQLSIKRENVDVVNSNVVAPQNKPQIAPTLPANKPGSAQVATKQATPPSTDQLKKAKTMEGYNKTTRFLGKFRRNKKGN